MRWVNFTNVAPGARTCATLPTIIVLGKKNSSEINTLFVLPTFIGGRSHLTSLRFARGCAGPRSLQGSRLWYRHVPLDLGPEVARLAIRGRPRARLPRYDRAIRSACRASRRILGNLPRSRRGIQPQSRSGPAE